MDNEDGKKSDRSYDSLSELSTKIGALLDDGSVGCNITMLAKAIGVRPQENQDVEVEVYAKKRSA